MKVFIAEEVARQLQKTAPSTLGFLGKCALSIGFNSAQSMFSVLGAAGALQAATFGLVWLTKRDVREVRKTQEIHGADLRVIKSNMNDIHQQLPDIKEANRIIQQEIPGIREQVTQMERTVSKGFEENAKDIKEIRKKMDELPTYIEQQHETTRLDLKQATQTYLSAFKAHMVDAFDSGLNLFGEKIEDKLEDQGKTLNKNIITMTNEIKKEVDDLKKTNEMHHQEIIVSNKALADEVKMHRSETKGEMLVIKDLLKEGIWHIKGLQLLAGMLNKRMNSIETSLGDMQFSSKCYTSLGTGFAGFTKTPNRVFNLTNSAELKNDNANSNYASSMGVD